MQILTALKRGPKGKKNRNKAPAKATLAKRAMKKLCIYRDCTSKSKYD
jgi:hypothetical protein